MPHERFHWSNAEGERAKPPIINSTSEADETVPFEGAKWAEDEDSWTPGAWKCVIIF
jgi:hypothetical protein